MLRAIDILRKTALIRYLAIVGIVLAFLSSALAQDIPVLTLDLTKPQPKEQQGLGVPGGRGGTNISGKPNEYEFPVQVKISGASVQNSGNVAVIEVQLTNVGNTAVELPVSQDIADVHRTSGSFRRELIFGLRPIFSDVPAQPIIVAVTAGSRAIPRSLVRLSPHQFIRVLLPAEVTWLKSTLPRNTSNIHLQVTCGEWALADNSFVVEATARQATSNNSVVLGFSDNTPTVTILSH